MRAVWLPDVLRAAGLTVRTVPGWETRCRPYAHGGALAVVWHHDASPPGDSPGVPVYMARELDAGRAGAQLWVARDGTWTVVASGQAAHAGTVLPRMPGNATSLGVETDHTVGELWPDVQLLALRRGTRAILDHQHLSSAWLHFHRTVCAPAGRKVDPDGLGLGLERDKVDGAALVRLTTPPTLTRLTAPEDDMDRLHLLKGARTPDVYQLDLVTGARRHVPWSEMQVRKAINAWDEPRTVDQGIFDALVKGNLDLE